MSSEPIAGRFTLVAKVGQGGVGTIYRAVDGDTGTTVALKLLHAVSAEESLRFAEEALALRSLDHPRIVHYVANGIDAAQRPFLAMEWLEGEDLASRLRRGALSLEETLDLARSVAAALAFIHQRGILHRAAARRDRVLMGDQMRRAFVDLVDAETRARPLLIVIEDAHLGDLASLRFVVSAIRALPRRPLGLWVVGRPTMPPRFVEALASLAPTKVWLHELSDPSARELVSGALGERVSSEVVTEIVSLGTGNPLVLEELVRATSEGTAEGSRSTLRALLEARLSLLSPDLVRVLEAAAMVGTSFWQGVLFELLPEVSREEIERALTDLVRREWIVEHASSKYHGELELAFRHGAILDAAEAGISAPSRAAAHGVVANWLERCGETDASVVAMHLHLAWRLGAAADHFARAAQRALEAGDFAVAAEHAAKGLACSPAAEVSGRLDVVAAQAHRWIGDNAAALLHSRRAMAALTPQGSAPSERWFEAAGEAISGASRLRKLDVMAEVSEALERTTKGLEPTPAQVVAIARAATLLAHAHIDVRAAPLFAYLDRVEPTVSADPLLRARIALARAWRSQTDGDWAG